MRRIVLFIAVMVLWPALALADIRFGVAAEPYPPFTYKDPSGNWVGWEIDVMNALCAKLNEKCSVVDVAWEGMIPALKAEKFDVVLASMAITEKRRAVIDFSNVYYNSSAQLASGKTQPAYRVREDLSGKRIAVQAASIHAAYAEKYFAPVGAVVKTYGKQDEVVSDLAAGRVDYVLADALALDAFLQSPSGACCAVAGTVAVDAELFGPGVGLGMRKQDAALKQRLNGAILDLIANGTLAAITETWHLSGKIALPVP